MDHRCRIIDHVDPEDRSFYIFGSVEGRYLWITLDGKRVTCARVDRSNKEPSEYKTFRLAGDALRWVMDQREWLKLGADEPEGEEG